MLAGESRVRQDLGETSRTTLAVSPNRIPMSSSATARALASAAPRDSMAWIALSMAATAARLDFCLHGGASLGGTLDYCRGALLRTI